MVKVWITPHKKLVMDLNFLKLEDPKTDLYKSFDFEIKYQQLIYQS